MNFAKAFRAALCPAYWPAMARVVVPTIEHTGALRGVEPRTVIDAGANKGQFSSFAHVRWPRSRIVAFEPLPEAAARYRATMGGAATLFACALGHAAGSREMHIASRRDSSSLLPLGDRQKTVFRMEEVATETVPVRRLDEPEITALIEAPALLKIDVQGFEHEVLRGLGALADKVRWIFVETYFVELYVGQKLHHEVAALLAGLGYEYTRERAATMQAGRKVQADCLFTKRNG